MRECFWYSFACRIMVHPYNNKNREPRQTTTTAATGTSPNKRFSEQNNSCARAL